MRSDIYAKLSISFYAFLFLNERTVNPFSSASRAFFQKNVTKKMILHIWILRHVQYCRKLQKRVTSFEI